MASASRSWWLIGLGTGLLYLLLLSILFWPLVNGQSMLFAGDIVQHYLPWEHFASRELARGDLPHLNPAFYCGHPLLAEGQSALFYPPTRLSYALVGQGTLAGDVQAFHLDLLLHWVIAGLGIWYAGIILGLPWRTAFLAGLFGCIAGLFLVLPVNVPILRVAVWTGWLIGAGTLFLRTGHRGAWLAVAGFWALCFLAGGPQMAALLIIGCALYGLASLLDVRHAPSPILTVLALALTPIIGAAIASVQLLPTWLFYQDSAIRQLHGAEALQYSATWLQLASWFVPPTWLTRLPPANALPAYSPPSLWIGTIGAMLSLVGLVSPRAPWRLKVWLCLLLLLALGGATPIYPALIKILPALSMFRAPDRYLAIALVPLCLLAAWGLEHLLADEEEEQPGRWPVWTAPALSALVMLGVMIALGSWGARLDTSAGMAESSWQILRAMTLDGGMQLLWLALFAGTGWLFAQGRFTSISVVSVCAVLTLVQTGLLKSSIPPLRMLPRAEALAEPAVAARIQEEIAKQPSAYWGRLVNVQPFTQAATLFGDMEAIEPESGQRMSDYLSWHHGAGESEAQLRRLRQLHPNTGTLWDLEYVGGIASLYTARMDHYLGFMENTQLASMLATGHRPQGTTLLDLAGGRYLLLPEAPPRSLMPSTMIGDQVVGINPRAKPLAWLLQPQQLLPETKEALESIVELRLNPDEVLVLDTVKSPRQGTAPAAVRPIVAWHWINARTLQLETEPLSDSWLIVSMQALNGWSARINGRAVPLHRAWGTFLAMPLPAGPQKVELKFETPGYQAGLQISIATLLALGFGLLWWSPIGDLVRARLQAPTLAEES